MEEDQRQLRRRIQELEKQLLMPLCNSVATTTTTPWTATYAPDETHIVDSRDCDDEEDEVQEKMERCIREESRGLNEKGRVCARKKLKLQDVDRSEASVLRMKPPVFLSIPKDQPALTCLYLTDGEGLSDSEFMENNSVDDDDFEEDGIDSGSKSEQA
jgi:hypothetical protein